MIEEYKTKLKSKLFNTVTISTNLEYEFFNKWNLYSLKKNEFLSSTDEIEKHVYFVINGVQKLCFMDEKGKEHILGFSFDHSLSGDPYSMLTQKRSMFYIKCITNSVFLRIDRNVLFKYIDEYTIFEKWWRRLLEQILIGRLEREVEIISCNAEERFEKLQKRSPRATKLIPQKDLASYLSMSAETYSRLRAKSI